MYWLAVLRRVGDRDGLALDRDAALPLDVHVVQDLVVELPFGDQTRALDEPVGERRLAVVDVRDDAEVADFRGFQGPGVYRERARACNAPRADGAALTGLLPPRSLASVSIGARPRVLVVDDQEALRSLLARLLEREGFDPVQAEDGAQAVEMYKSESPLVVVSDIMMPRMDGLTLLNEIRRIDRNATVILMTGQGNEDVLLKALRGGATNFFKKPFNVRELIDEIRKVVDFRLEAARSSLFSPLLVEETKSLRHARAPTRPFFPSSTRSPCSFPASCRRRTS